MPLILCFEYTGCLLFSPPRGDDFAFIALSTTALASAQFGRDQLLFSLDHEVKQTKKVFKTICKVLATVFVSHLVTKRPKWAYDTILKSLESLISWIESVWKLNLI